MSVSAQGDYYGVAVDEWGDRVFILTDEWGNGTPAGGGIAARSPAIEPKTLIEQGYITRWPG